MPNLYTVPAGNSVAEATAAHLLARYAPGELANAVLLLPTRRSAVVMRRAFQQALGGKAALLPRMVPLAEIGQEMLTLLGGNAFDVLENIPTAMPASQQRYLLTEQVAAFERRRGLGTVTLGYALKMAEALMVVQEKCARANVTLTQEKLRELVYRDVADHWKQALLFLGILTDSWPEIEAELGMVIAPTRDVRMLAALSHAWAANPPDFPIIAVGSTGSQHATAQLLKTIADLPTGAVILPGPDPTLDDATWAAICCGHPLHHLKQLLDLWPIPPREVTPLSAPTPSLWLEALAPLEQITDWPNRALPPHENIRLIPCAHGEEEARIISLLIREALESADKHVAVITPDEGLLARVATHMQRYGILVDRMTAGTLLITETGSLWAALAAAIAEPERLLTLRALLHHRLLAIDSALLSGLEKGWHGLNRSRAGQLPRHDPALKSHPGYAALADFVQQLAALSRREMVASEWRAALQNLLLPLMKISGQGADAVAQQLDALDHANGFGPLAIEEFADLLAERLQAKWRAPGIAADRRVHLLTPIEARLQQFDRTILANMQEAQWPGLATVNPWLNLAAEKALGLSAPEEQTSLAAHDVLMLASRGEIFLTYPQREGGSPVPRSRFIERLVTLLASHGIDEAAITAAQYVAWSDALFASPTFAPELPVRPLPSTEQRPTRLPVTDIDKLFTDPFSIYAKHVLGLRALDAIDAAPEASDFGNLAHRAIEALTCHWNEQGAAATEAELVAIAAKTLRELSERPNIDLFWRSRLMGGLRYVNALETERRINLLKVESELSVEKEFFLNSPLEGESNRSFSDSVGGNSSHQSITLYGRIDRIETGGDGATIIDYKTGEIPTAKAILDGRALQLMAYAMLVGAQEPAEKIEYWQLPRLGDVGDSLAIPTAATLPELEEKLKAALAQMLDPATPFLARPVSTSVDDRFGNDYDGISRYDEWAG